MTNGDRIRSMTDEELAEFLALFDESDGKNKEDSKTGWLLWLKRGRMGRVNNMDKSCFNCEHGEKYVWNEDYAYCDLDIGEIIENPKAAEECPFYAFCGESE